MISGLIYNNNRVFFTIKINNKIEYFYMPRNLVKKFAKYLKKGIFVHFEIQGNKTTHRNISCYKVDHFIEISNKRKREKKIFYSLDTFRNGIRDLLSSLKYTVFIDFEFNMHDYYSKNFIPEIIEVGYCLCDNNLSIINEKQMYLVPTKVKKITKRAIKFLNYKKEHLENRLSYDVFYKDFKKLIKDYDPCFIVWGRSDIETLRTSFKINKVKNINFKFIDLSSVHVNYYNLKNTPGLFKAAEEYNNIELPKQRHNALEDALMTKLVFSNFKETIK